MAEVQANPKIAGLRRPPAAPLFAAVLAFCGGILLQTYCYKPAVLYLLCTAGLMLCSAAALRYVYGARGARVAYCAAVLAFDGIDGFLKRLRDLPEFQMFGIPQ